MTELLQEIAPDIWRYEQPGEPAISSRTIVRLSSGGLWIHSPPELTDELKQAVLSLGTVEALVAPNNAHHMYLPDWLQAFPGASSYVAKRVPAKQPELQGYRLIEDVAADLWSEDLEVAVMKGVPLFDECVFLHRKSRTLILTDLIQNYPPAKGLFAKLFFGPMGWKGVCPPPPTRFDFITHDRAALMRFVDEVESWSFERIALTHGKWIERDAKAVFSEIRERIRTDRGSAFHGFLMRQMISRLMDGGLPEPD